MADGAKERREEIDDLLTSVFNSILRIEEKSLDNRLTEGLSITEIHTIDAIGYREANPMNVVASRLGVTLATLTICVNRLVEKGFLIRERDTADRRRVLVSLSRKGRAVYRAHRLFHRQMVDEALGSLSVEEERVLASALAKVRAFFEERA